MWIFLNDAFVSVVAHRRRSDLLMARARLLGDLQRAFGRCLVWETTSADYRYRAVLTRKRVARAIAEHALSIDYDNFKDSVSEDARHAAYMRVWEVMSAEQRASHRTPDARALRPSAPAPAGLRGSVSVGHPWTSALPREWDF